jgi:hypothetical protein
VRDAERRVLIRRQRRRVVLWQGLSTPLFLVAGVVCVGMRDLAGIGIAVILLVLALFTAAAASIARISLAVLANPALERYEHGWFPGYSFPDYMGLDFQKPRPALGGVPGPVPVSRPPVHRNKACPCGSGRKWKYCHGRSFLRRLLRSVT